MPLPTNHAGVLSEQPPGLNLCDWELGKGFNMEFLCPRGLIETWKRSDRGDEQQRISPVAAQPRENLKNIETAGAF